MGHGTKGGIAPVAALVASLATVLIRAAPADADSTPTNPVVLPFELRRGHVMVPARATNETSVALSLLLDTGYSMTMLHPEHVASLGLKRAGRITIVGIAGEEPAAVLEGPVFDFSGATWRPRRVAAFPDGAQGRGRRRDGILGSGFFRRFVVEIDSTRKQLRLHEPNTYHFEGGGEVLPFHFSGNTPVIEATVRLADNSEVAASLEVDTGCDSCVCLGQHFVAAHQLAPTNAPGTDVGGANRFGVGGGARTRTTHLPQLRLGKLAIDKPEVNLFLEGSPVDPPLAGHIGWELLQKFTVILDYQRRQLILQPPR